MSDDLRFAIMPLLVTIGAALGGAALGVVIHAVTRGGQKDEQGKPVSPVLAGSAPLALGVFAAFVAASIAVRGWNGWWPVAVVDRLPQFAAVALLGAMLAGAMGWRKVPRPVGIALAALARLGASFAIVWWITVTARQFDWESGVAVAWVSGLTLAMAAVWTAASVAGRSMRGPLAALSLSLLAGGSSGAVFLGAMPSSAHALGVFGIGMLALAGVTLVLRGLGGSPVAVGVGVASLLAAWGGAWQYADLSGWALLLLAIAPLGLMASALLGRFTKWKPWLRGLVQLIVIALVLGGAAGVQYAANEAASADQPEEEYVW